MGSAQSFHLHLRIPVLLLLLLTSICGYHVHAQQNVEIQSNGQVTPDGNNAAASNPSAAAAGAAGGGFGDIGMMAALAASMGGANKPIVMFGNAANPPILPFGGTPARKAPPPPQPADPQQLFTEARTLLTSKPPDIKKAQTLLERALPAATEKTQLHHDILSQLIEIYHAEISDSTNLQQFVNHAYQMLTTYGEMYRQQELASSDTFSTYESIATRLFNTLLSTSHTTHAHTLISHLMSRYPHRLEYALQTAKLAEQMAPASPSPPTMLAEATSLMRNVIKHDASQGYTYFIYRACQQSLGTMEADLLVAYMSEITPSPFESFISQIHACIASVKSQERIIGYMSLGVLYQSAIRFSAAIEHFQKAVDIIDAEAPSDPRRSTILGLMLQCAMKITDYDMRHRIIQQILPLSTSYPVMQPLTALWLGVNATQVAAISKYWCGLAEQQAIQLIRIQNDTVKQSLRDMSIKRRTTLEAGSVRMQKETTSVLKPHRIVLGYVSTDFRDHAIGWLTYSLFGVHHRSRFIVYCYSLDPPLATNDTSRSAPIRAHFHATCDRFIYLHHLNDVHAALKIAEDGVDILLDLNSWTAGNRRPGIMVMRPAPIQINFQSYAGTSSCSALDYIVVDDILIEPQQAHESPQHFSEQLLIMPHSYQCNSHKQLYAHISTYVKDRTSYGVPKDGIPVLCNFNKYVKFDAIIWSLWFTILHRLPTARLWLLTPSYANATIPSIHKLLEKANLTHDRIIFAPHIPYEQHLVRLPSCDIFIDTLTYGAHTTATDALWMGVPLVTRFGPAFANRVAASLLHAAGAPELITYSDEDYVETIIHLISTELGQQQLTNIRQRLINSRMHTSAFHTKRWVRHWEHHLQRVWARRRLTQSNNVTVIDQALLAS